MRVLFTINLIYITFIYVVKSAPQQEPEVFDQFEESNHTEIETRSVQQEDTRNVQYVETNAVMEDINIPLDINTKNEISDHVQINEAEPQPEVKSDGGFIKKLFIAIKKPIIEFIEVPKINTVLRNIGTCVVNGAMEIVSFYFPAPLIPLIASAAGMFIPFEPVVMLRKRMPVTSYRRAFKTAINSFMGTFDRFKASAESEEDPYMTRRFNKNFLRENTKTNGDEN